MAATILVSTVSSCQKMNTIISFHGRLISLVCTIETNTILASPSFLHVFFTISVKFTARLSMVCVAGKLEFRNVCPPGTAPYFIPCPWPLHFLYCAGADDMQRTQTIWNGIVWNIWKGTQNLKSFRIRPRVFHSIWIVSHLPQWWDILLFLYY